MTPWDFSNPDTTHICHQTGEVLKTTKWIQEYQEPLMIDETGYEGNLPFGWGNLSAFELVNRFWTVCVQGGYCTMIGLTWEQARGILGVDRELEGHCGEEAYTKYYARYCTGTGSMNLTEQYLYDIEEIDVWEMARTKIMEVVSREVRITLPGKEGIAVMAVRKG